MANIKIIVDGPLMDGHKLTFKAPCNCDVVEYLDVRYIKNNAQASKLFTMKDTHGNDLTGLGNLFYKDSYVSVVLDTVNNFAYLQNAATNKYLEEKMKTSGGGTGAGAVELTQAEYDELPQEEKDKDVIYFITDGEVSDDNSGIPEWTKLSNSENRTVVLPTDFNEIHVLAYTSDYYRITVRLIKADVVEGKTYYFRYGYYNGASDNMGIILKVTSSQIYVEGCMVNGASETTSVKVEAWYR